MTSGGLEGLIEGDYIETVEGLLFVVKGVHHPEKKVIAYLRYLPDPGGNRKRGEKKYRRVYDLEMTTNLLLSNYPQYLCYEQSKGLILQTVPKTKVKQIFRAREELEKVVAEPKNELEEILSKFSFTLSSEGGLPISKMGVSGSMLVDLAIETSDVDLIVYGSEAGQKAYKALKTMRKKYDWISPYDKITIDPILRARWGDTDLDVDKYRKVEITKVLHGLVDNRDYFVRLVKHPREVEAEISSKPIGKIKLRGTIQNADESIFTPCTYQLKRNSIKRNNSGYEVSELFSYRGKFTEQVKEKDVVEVMGTLEEVCYIDRRVYRIMMSSPRDYLIAVHGLNR